MTYQALAIDLHNTIYDEVLEYGLAIEEAVIFWKHFAQKQGVTLTNATLHSELASAHRRIGSDWEGEVWHHLPSLMRLRLSDAEFAKTMKEAETLRRRKSRQLMTTGLYSGVIEALTELKRRNIPIYIITEAAADVAMKSVEWLKLAGIIDGVYSYPSKMPPHAIRQTYHKPFPSAGNREHLKKPHPYLLAAVILDETVRKGSIPASTKLDDVFAVASDQNFSIPDLPSDGLLQKSIGARLVFKDISHAQALRQTLQTTLYVGDSKFKDGLLARNAGIAFGYAAYGKKVAPENKSSHKKSLDIMYAVTGWDEEVIKLTQESARSEIVNNLQPKYTFENSLTEALELFAS